MENTAIMQLHEPLDTWTPEARGSSARLFAAEIKTDERKTISAALKLMRPNRTDYALPLFREEAQVLSLMRDVNGCRPINRMRISQAGRWPPAA